MIMNVCKTGFSTKSCKTNKPDIIRILGKVSEVNIFFKADIVPTESL